MSQIVPTGEKSNDRRRAAVEFLEHRGAQNIDHVEGDLLTHLLGTEAILRSWETPEDLALAGLCHAVYGTAGFAPHLLTVDRRGELIAVIGAEAEGLAYRYASCDRSAVYPRAAEVPMPFIDRFTGESLTLGPPGARAFALLTTANELELVRRVTFTDQVLGRIADLIADLEVHAPDILSTECRELPHR